MEAAGGEGWQAGVQLGWVTLMMCPVKREEGSSSVSLRKALFVALGLDQALTLLGAGPFRESEGRPCNTQEGVVPGDTQTRWPHSPSVFTFLITSQPPHNLAAEVKASFPFCRLRN